jgi:hypothetical protein
MEQQKKRSPWYTYAWVWLVLGIVAYLLGMRWAYRDYMIAVGLNRLCRPGRMESLKKRLENEPELVGQKLQYADGNFGLVHMVCRNHNLEGIQYLKSMDADFSQETAFLGDTPLSILSETFYPNTLESIREVVSSRFVGSERIIRPNRSGISPIMVSIIEYQPLILKEYLEILKQQGGEVDKDALLQLAVKDLRENNDGHTIVSMLVAEGANPAGKNADGKSALDLAREAKKEDFVALMVGK